VLRQPGRRRGGLQVLHGARSARPRRHRGRGRRCTRRLPVVEHLARPALHGRHRFARPRRRARRPRGAHPHRAAARAHRRPVHHHDRLGDPAARVLQGHQVALWNRQTHLPDESAAPPLRAQGLGRDHRRGALLDHRRTVRGGRGRRVLSRMVRALSTPLSELTSWRSDWSGLRVAVLGLGVTGFAVADTLTELGAEVLVVAARGSDDHRRLLDVIGARFVQHPDDAGVPEELLVFGPELVVTSPGYHPDHPLLLWAAEAGIPVWGDIELAWRLRDKVLRADGTPADWILVTGTNGKTTTTQLTAHMLVAGGLKAAPAGNIGIPVLDAIRDPGGFDVLVVELSSYQLHWTHRNEGGELAPLASVCLNIADDHLDWHGSREAYVAAKGRVYENTRIACVYNLADEATMRLVE